MRISDWSSDVCSSDLIPVFQWECPAFALDDGRILHQPRIGGPVERGGHDEQPQVRPPRPLGVERQRKRGVALQTSFVRFVEQHGGTTGKLRVGLNADREYERKRVVEGKRW